MTMAGECRSCGHSRRQHFTPVPTNKLPIDAPCPCYFVVDDQPCGCTAAVTQLALSDPD